MIHAILPLTGGAAFLGKQEDQALQIYAGQLNSRGGVSGRAVRFTVQDDESNPQVDVQILQGLSSRHVALVLGPSIAASCKAVQPLVSRGPLVWCLSPGAYPAPNSYLFTVMTSVVAQNDALLTFFKSRGWYTLGSLVSRDATGQDCLNKLLQVLKQPDMKPMKLLDSESFNPQDLSVQAQVARIAAQHPQALFTCTTGAAQQTIFKAQLGMGLTLPSAASSGNATTVEMKAFNASAPGNVYFASGRWVAADRLPPGEGRQQVDAFIGSMTSHGADPNLMTAAAWDTAHIAVAAVRKLGFGATATELRDYVQGLTGYQGAWGVYSFSASDHRGLNQADTYVARWDRSTETFRDVSGPGGTVPSPGPPPPSDQ